MLGLEQPLQTHLSRVTSRAFPGTPESSCPSFPDDREKKATPPYPSESTAGPGTGPAWALGQRPLLSARQYWVTLL